MLMQRPVWDRALLGELAQAMRDASICGLGQAAPNPLTCVMRYFPEEFAAERHAACMTRVAITFELDGAQVEAAPGETIWQVAQRLGTDDPASLLLAGARLPAGRQLPRLHGGDRGRARARRLLHAQAAPSA